MDDHSHKPPPAPVTKLSGLGLPEIITEAIRAVPAVKFALGIAGVAAIVAVIAGFRIDYRVMVLGIIIMFVLMFLLVIFSAFARFADKSVKNLAIVLAWSFAILTIATALLIFTEFFFSWPRSIGQTTEGIIGRKASSTPSPAPPAPSPIQTRLLNYSINVCKARIDPGCKKPFSLAGEINFEEDYRIRINTSSPQPGELYVINEGPLRNDGLPQYVLLFPNEQTNEGVARLESNQMITIPKNGWLIFDKEQGREKLWFVWSAQSIGVLESASRQVVIKRKQDAGAITDPVLISSIREILEQPSRSIPEIARNEEINQTSLKTEGQVLVYALKLEHH